MGTEEAERERTLQPAVPKPQPAEPGGTDASDSGKAQEDKEKEGNGDEVDKTESEDIEGVPGTYSQGYDPNQMANASAVTDSSLFGSDILGDVADSALSAVLRGQNVKDAILTTAVNRVSTAVGNAINESNDNPNPNVAVEDQIKNPQNPPE